MKLEKKIYYYLSKMDSVKKNLLSDFNSNADCPPKQLNFYFLDDRNDNLLVTDLSKFRFSRISAKRFFPVCRWESVAIFLPVTPKKKTKLSQAILAPAKR